MDRVTWSSWSTRKLRSRPRSIRWSSPLSSLWVNQLAALTSTKAGFRPFLINGRPLKHLNAYYNKQRASHQSRLAKQNRFTSRQLDRITTKRNRRVNTYLHTASRRIIDLLVKEGIGTLVIGLNKQWKQEVDMGKRTDQTFVQIPHSRFIQMLQYKARLVGITVVVREESYTSKASFLDLDDIPSSEGRRSWVQRFTPDGLPSEWI